MKAIIMAGGQGSRLRPISANAPKPMVSLFDRPVLEHTLQHLKQNGITEACLTLQFMPQMIVNHFGDGGKFGMQLTHKIETTPLGTAGSVAACRDFYGDESIIVISGDAVCNFDLQKCIDFHNQREADATIVLYAEAEPLEYGLVMTDENGRIERFIEKPPWNQVFTNRINTGIYILSPKALAEIPTEGAYDFGKDFFPRLLEQGFNLYGVEAAGYWCDIGNPQSYLQCVRDALDEKIQLDFGTLRRGQALWAHSAVPTGVTVHQPCYIGKSVVLENGAVVGPYAVVGENSHIGQSATVSRCVIDGATVGAGCAVDGAAVGRGAGLRDGCVLQEGAVVGDGTIIGAGAVVQSGVRVWSHKEIAPGSVVAENVVTGQPRAGLRFSGGGTIWGESGVDLSIEAAFAIGSALGKAGRVGIAAGGGDSIGNSGIGSRQMARSLALGVQAAGGQSFELDAGFDSVAGYAADLYGFQRSVFVQQMGNRLKLRAFGPRGLPITREQERQVESALTSGDLCRADADKLGEMASITGTSEAYITAAADWGKIDAEFTVPNAQQTAVHVSGTGGANRSLRAAFSRMGVTLGDTNHGAIPTFETAHGGMVLRAEDEMGYTLESKQLLAILVNLEFKRGAKTLAVPYAAPHALDHIATGFGAKILRLGRDADAESIYYQHPYLRDAVFAATRLVGYMTARGKTLHELAAETPQFRTAQYEVVISTDKAAVMQKLAAAIAEPAAELIEGLRLPTETGWVHISPSTARPVLKILSESTSMETAEEICVDFARQLELLDQ